MDFRWARFQNSYGTISPGLRISSPTDEGSFVQALKRDSAARNKLSCGATGAKLNWAK